MTLAAGTRLGPGEIRSAVGAGGRREVYKDRDASLDRTVAIKILSQDAVEIGGRRRRFEQEASAVSALNHPHMCTLPEMGSAVLSEASGQMLVDLDAAAAHHAGMGNSIASVTAAILEHNPAPGGIEQ